MSVPVEPSAEDWEKACNAAREHKPQGCGGCDGHPPCGLANHIVRIRAEARQSGDRAGYERARHEFVIVEFKPPKAEGS